FAGSPRERGRQYGSRFQADIAGFLEREIYGAFVGRPAKRDELLRYADACAGRLQGYSPVVHEEMTGIAEGTGLTLSEVTLISLHEELYHRGDLPPVEHCTAVAVGPPDTNGGTFVGQTWDWMQSVFGLSRVVHWQRSEGPAVLAYGFPGMWCGAGLNSAGLALCWTSADLGTKGLGVRIGIPSYALLTHFLYQSSLDEVAEEARRATNAGWFTFVMADGQGNLLNVEGSPRQIVVEKATGHLVRVGFGSRAMSEKPSGPPIRMHPRCARMQDLLTESSGKTDLGQMQRFFEDPACQISVGKSTIDMMVFDCTARVAYCSRGPSYATAWQRFTFT
ncbi:MAG: C45 family autoproteolytic acyltransferase/hydrolase, partial [Pirellulaceae bacterium]